VLLAAAVRRFVHMPLGISDRNSIIQQPVNAGSRRIGVKTARPGVDY